MYLSPVRLISRIFLTWFVGEKKITTYFLQHVHLRPATWQMRWLVQEESAHPYSFFPMFPEKLQAFLRNIKMKANKSIFSHSRRNAKNNIQSHRVHYAGSLSTAILCHRPAVNQLRICPLAAVYVADSTCSPPSSASSYLPPALCIVSGSYRAVTWFDPIADSALSTWLD